MHLGLYTKYYRINILRLRQSDIAKAIGCTIPNVSNFERGLCTSYKILEFYIKSGFCEYYDLINRHFSEMGAEAIENLRLIKDH